jgi:hypothetical protein
LSTALENWRFTSFDVVPVHAEVEINEGFGKGIKTNAFYKDLYNWIKEYAEIYTQKNDFIITYNISPMVHMITKRRPSLDESRIDIKAFPDDYYIDAIRKMMICHREPKMAFVFENLIMLYPVSIDKEQYRLSHKQFSFPHSDPLSIYISKYMYQVDQFKVNNEVIARCFIRK